MQMFGSIKYYLYIASSIIVIAILGYLKYLKVLNKEAEDTINNLKKQLEINKKLAKENIKRKVFRTKQVERAKVLDNTEKDIDKIEEEKDETIIVDNNDFVSIRL